MSEQNAVPFDRPKHLKDTAPEPYRNLLSSRDHQGAIKLIIDYANLDPANFDEQVSDNIYSRLDKISSPTGRYLAGAVALEAAVEHNNPLTVQDWLAKAQDKWQKAEHLGEIFGPTSQSLRSQIGLAMLPIYASVIIDKKFPNRHEQSSIYRSLLNIGQSALERTTQVIPSKRPELGPEFNAMIGLNAELSLIMLAMRHQLRFSPDQSSLAGAGRPRNLLPVPSLPRQDRPSAKSNSRNQSWDISLLEQMGPSNRPVAPNLVTKIQVKAARKSSGRERYASDIKVVLLNGDIFEKHDHRNSTQPPSSAIIDLCLIESYNAAATNNDPTQATGRETSPSNLAISTELDQRTDKFWAAIA